MKKVNLGHYEFFETMKDIIMIKYDIEKRYHPSKITDEYANYLRKNNVRIAYFDSRMPLLDDFLKECHNLNIYYDKGS